MVDKLERQRRRGEKSSNWKDKKKKKSKELPDVSKEGREERGI